MLQRHSARIAYQRRNLMTQRKRLLDHQPARKPCCTKNGDA
jgi:hypothetical protein